MVFVKYDYIPVGSMDKLVLVFYTAVFVSAEQILKRAENYYRSCAVGIASLYLTKTGNSFNVLVSVETTES